jgi:predicted nucleotidyltransferase component of viral defense system
MMLQFNRAVIGKQAKQYGFVRDTFEKTCRLISVLEFIQQDEWLAELLSLKGGTAINLTIFDLPRLSVDIDLDFSINVTKDEMRYKRQNISLRLAKHMENSGYRLSDKTRKHHALDSFVYDYVNAGGVRDNLKIEINYMLRCHVLPLTIRSINLPWMEREVSVQTVAPIEIFASKIVALLNRAVPRDLFDIYNMLSCELIEHDNHNLLRKCVIFYSAISSQSSLIYFDFEEIKSITQYRIKTDLLPVLRQGKYFNAEPAQDMVIEYLDKLLVPTDGEIEFLNLFQQNIYRPELIFGDTDVSRRIINHPMALWKCRDKLAHDFPIDKHNQGSKEGVHRDY